jgi:hypothetical protein
VVSGQLHVPAALHPDIEPLPYPLYRKLCGPGAGLNIIKKREKNLALLGMEPRLQVTIPTESTGSVIG